MTRQSLRNDYPFHAVNPRAYVPCCTRQHAKPAGRPISGRVVLLIVALLSIVALAKVL